MYDLHYISTSGHQVVIKVSDEAGGIARSQLADVWMYNSGRLRGGSSGGHLLRPDGELRHNLAPFAE